MPNHLLHVRRALVLRMDSPLSALEPLLELVHGDGCVGHHAMVLRRLLVPLHDIDGPVCDGWLDGFWTSYSCQQGVAISNV